MNHISDEQARKMLTTMMLIREFETKATDLIRAGKVRGVIHSYVGQEAIAVGTCSTLNPGDYLTSTHRGHGHCLAKGGDPERMFAELMGRRTGYCKGKGGSMHITDAGLGILGANGIVGGGLPLAVGAALGAKLQKSGRVVVAFFGDGASNQGTFHESLNLAAIWALPVIFVCENNQYAISTPVAYSVPVANIADRARAYGISSSVCDGNDVLEVFGQTQAAVAAARSGRGPFFLEAKTYRIEGHHFGDDARYRSPEEVEAWRSKDPIKRLISWLVDRALILDEEASVMWAKVRSQVEQAAQRAWEAPEPSAKELLSDVFYDSQLTQGVAAE